MTVGRAQSCQLVINLERLQAPRDQLWCCRAREKWIERVEVVNSTRSGKLRLRVVVCAHRPYPPPQPPILVSREFASHPSFLSNVVRSKSICLKTFKDNSWLNKVARTESQPIPRDQFLTMYTFLHLASAMLGSSEQAVKNIAAYSGCIWSL